jgi:hypothetical protein
MFFVNGSLLSIERRAVPLKVTEILITVTKNHGAIKTAAVERRIS